MKQTFGQMILGLAAMLMLSLAAYACECSSSDGAFLKVAERSQMIVRAKVIRYHWLGSDKNKGGTAVAMTVEIKEVYKGAVVESRRIKIWGDDGSLCRPYVSQFPLNTEWVFALSEAGYGTGKGELEISVCGEYWLKVKGGNVVGRIMEVGDKAKSRTLTLRKLRRLLKLATFNLSKNSKSNQFASNEKSNFSYGGLGLHTDITRLLAEYPKSAHEFINSEGRRFVPPDNSSIFQEMIKTGTGFYLIRLDRNEAHNDLYFVEASIEAGQLRKLNLSFEKPFELPNKRYKNSLAEYEARHPRCSVITKALLAQYGKPKSSYSASEEALQSTFTVWAKDNERLSLECGRYDERTKIFAMNITIEVRQP